MFKKCLAAAFITALLFSHAAAGSTIEIDAQAETEVAVGETLLFLNVLRGLPATSTVANFTINTASIPDDAIVEKITVMTGTIRTIAGTVVVDTYSLQGPGMSAPATRKWGGTTMGTAFSDTDLGGAVPVQGRWSLYFTARTVSPRSGSVSHNIPTVKIRYSYKKKIRQP